jgi:hypothetical protein
MPPADDVPPGLPVEWKDVVYDAWHGPVVLGALAV